MWNTALVWLGCSFHTTSLWNLHNCGSVSMAKIKPCVCVCAHLPEAGPVSRTEPASCPWETHHWPAAAALRGTEEEGEDALTKAQRIKASLLGWVSSHIC